MIQILALYHDFEGAKNIHVLTVLIWGLRGYGIFWTGVWDLDLDLDMVTGLCCTHVLIWVLYLHFDGAKNINVLQVLTGV